MVIMNISSLLILLLPSAAWSSSEVWVKIPTYSIQNADLVIKCSHAQGLKAIRTLVWYKDGHQFFKYSATEVPRISFRNQSFFKFDIYSVEKGELHLRNLSLESSGLYKCEISKGTNSEPPSWAEAMLNVIELPEQAAEINVGRNSYRIGEEIEANCSAILQQSVNMSLTWRINHGTAEKYSGKLIKYSLNATGTKYYSRSIRFTAEKSKFINGVIKLECEATIPEIFQKSTVVFIKEEHNNSQLLTRASRVRRGIDVTVEIPSYKEQSTTAELKCLYSLQGASLYSVKWYKGSKQIYEYIPAKRETKKSFPLPHLQLDLDASNEGHVFLRNLSMDASGQYKCEVITEAPHFYTKFGEGNMTVIDLPESAPVLDGLRNSYQLGEEVHVNCSSPSSKPAAALQWQINDKIVNNTHWLIKYPVTLDNRNLETSVLGLQFIATRDHFSGETMRLKCQAQIGNLYYQSQENVVLHTNSLQRKQESHGYYLPSFFYNSSPTIKYSEVLLSFLLFLYHFLLL